MKRQFGALLTVLDREGNLAGALDDADPLVTRLLKRKSGDIDDGELVEAARLVATTNGLFDYSAAQPAVDGAMDADSIPAAFHDQIECIRHAEAIAGVALGIAIGMRISSAK